MATSVGTLLGRYEIDAELGRGAMGVVYRARDPRIDRIVAIKTVSLLGLEPHAEQEYRERFIVEARAAGRLSHPRIVTIHDVAEDPFTLTPYIVMEYVSGRSLEEVLRTENGALPLDTALQVTQELAEALDYAHAQGIVHRDVKPSNIIVATDGHPKIADFGIAKLNAPDFPQTGLTLGTPAYMSPEQLRGDLVDGRSDLFSLGIILYQLLTGHRPFQGNSTHTIAFNVLNRDPVPAPALNSELRPELGHVITRAMAKDPAQRYQTGKEMVLHLQSIRENIVLPSSDHGRDPANWGRVISFNSTLPVAVQSGGSHGDTDSRSNAVSYSQPWQQLTIGFLTIGCLALAFVGLWQAIPINSPRILATAFVFPDRSKTTISASIGMPKTGAENATESQATSKQSWRRASLNGRARSNPTASGARMSDQQASLPSTLRISVEHHFGTAQLSVWIDGKLTYSSLLNGALKKRMLLFKGVQGYFSDSLEVGGGEHLIRVRVLSADNSYDQSASIRGNFVPGTEKILTTQFDKNNRGMRLSLQ